jgi:hypothetical protein
VARIKELGGRVVVSKVGARPVARSRLQGQGAAHVKELTDSVSRAEGKS